MTNLITLDQLKKTHEQLAFIHSVLTQRTQYYLDEVDVAKDAAKTITDMANKLSDDIKSQIDADNATVVTEPVETINE